MYKKLLPTEIAVVLLWYLSYSQTIYFG